MSAGGDGRASVRTDSEDDRTTRLFRKQNSVKSAAGDDAKTPSCAGNCSLRLPKRSEVAPGKYLKCLGRKMAAVLLQLVSPRNRASSSSSSSSSAAAHKSKISCGSAAGRSKPMVAPIDSHRAEAIDDCIEFINSSSTLPRTNSVSAAA